MAKNQQGVQGITTEAMVSFPQQPSTVTSKENMIQPHSSLIPVTQPEVATYMHSLHFIKNQTPTTRATFQISYMSLVMHNKPTHMEMTVSQAIHTLNQGQEQDETRFSIEHFILTLHLILHEEDFGQNMKD